MSRYPVLCSACRAECEPVGGSVCSRCGRPLVSEELLCTRCRVRPDNCANRAVGDYRGRLRELLSLYKLSGKRELASILGELLLPAVGDTLVGRTVIPVPASRQRLRWLGWDPVLVVLRLVEKQLSIRILPLLIRNEGLQQKELGYQARLENAETLFSLHRGSRPDWAPTRLEPDNSAAVLFDDIFTTGATMSVCRRLVESEGLKVAGSVTIAVD